MLVKFDRYDGPQCFDELADELAGVVPVFRSKREFLRGNTNCSRTQFLLTIAYAITVDKSQGGYLREGLPARSYLCGCEPRQEATGRHV